MPTPPSTVAVPPRPTRIAVGCAASVASSSSPSPRLVACTGSRSSREQSGSPTASAESITAVPSSSSSHRAATAGQWVGDDGGPPLAAECSVDHLGHAFAAVGDRRLDRLDAVDAPHARREERRRLDGVRTPLRLAGEARHFIALVSSSSSICLSIA